MHLCGHYGEQKKIMATKAHEFGECSKIVLDYTVSGFFNSLDQDEKRFHDMIHPISTYSSLLSPTTSEFVVGLIYL